MTRVASTCALQLKERNALLRVCHALFVLSKPGIVAAVTLSGYAGMVLAGREAPPPGTVLSCLASLLFMASGSALVNGVLDRRTDLRMERLSRRSAALKSLGAGPAIAAAATLSCAALVLAWVQLNALVVLLLLVASLSYAFCYTLLLKPRTHWAAILGALPGALPVLIGALAMREVPDPASLALFLILLIWQPPHFWLLALAYLEDYRAAGLPVLPLSKGTSFTRQCIRLWVLALIPASLLPWLVGPCSDWYALSATVLGLWFLLSCHHSLTRTCEIRPLFRVSLVYLLLLLSALIVDLTL